MALVDNAFYCNFGDGSTTGHYAVTQWAALTTKNCGNLVRQLAAPAVGSERVFVCIIGAIATLASEPTWTTTRGAKTAEAASVTWQECTGVAALNGDLTNTPTWTTVKNTAITLGQVIQNVAGTLILICSTAGTAGNGAEPSWAAFTNAGATTADNTATWTTLGASFSTWSAPHARGANALTATWVQAGNKVYVGDNHAETQASALTWTGAGTSALPVQIYCVDRTVAVPPTTLATTATVTTTGASTLTLSGIFYTYGITFNCGSGAVTSGWTLGVTNGPQTFENCAVRKLGTSSSTTAGGMNSGKIRYINSTLQFGSTGDSIRPAGTFIWENTLSAITGGVAPTTMFITSGSTGNFVLKGVDISGFGNTFNAAIVTATPFALIDCKLQASMAFATPGSPTCSIDVIRADSGATNYRNERYLYQGTQTTETTIVRTGGASDGTTPISWKIVSTANSKWISPFESQPITIWNDSTSAITTLTFYGTTTGGGVPNNDDIWVEVEYLGSASTPQGSFISTTKANNLAASVTTNNSSDGSTWGGSGAGNGFKIVVPTHTPGMKGPMNMVVKVAKASSTYYIDPRPSISGVTVSKSEILAPGVYANELSSGGGGISRARAAGGF